MQTPPTVTFRGVRYPAVLETDVRTRLNRLERYYPAIVSARVRLDGPGRSKGATRFRVLVELGVPGADVIVSHEGHRQAQVAIREAFEAARRRLQEYSRRKRRTS